MDLKETYNRIAEDWHKDHQQDDWWIEGTDRFVSLLPKGGSVLDVGCAGGIKTKYFLDRGFSVTGIDISENLIEIAKREVTEAEYKVMSMTELNSMDKQFDGVFAQASLLHIPKAQAADVVRMMAERTVPGGYVYLAVKKAKQEGMEEEVKEEDDYGYTYQRFFSYFTLEELRSYLVTAGLEISWEDAYLSGRTTWLQIVGKKPLA